MDPTGHGLIKTLQAIKRARGCPRVSRTIQTELLRNPKACKYSHHNTVLARCDCRGELHTIYIYGGEEAMSCPWEGPAIYEYRLEA